MDIFTVIMAFAAITSTLFNIGKSIDDSQEAKKTSEDQKDLAEKQLKLNTDVANQNFALSKEQFEYQKQLNQLQMDREDSAFQRQVADLKKAGLSPLMVSGNGATSNPLTSASAPQFDLTGINQAMSNMISAYNDSFNRKMQSKQFALQSKVQTAQAYTQLAETYMQKKRADLENIYLSEKLEWEKTHGFRDYNWKSDLTKLIEDILNKKGNSIIPDLPNLKDGLFNDNAPSFGEIKDRFLNLLNTEEEEKPIPVNPGINKPTQKQISDDQKKIIDEMKSDYNKAMNFVTTRKPDSGEKYTSCLEFIYKHTDAQKDYQSIFTFRQAIESSPELRRNLMKKYPFISPKTPW